MRLGLLRAGVRLAIERRRAEAGSPAGWMVFVLMHDGHGAELNWVGRHARAVLVIAPH